VTALDEVIAQRRIGIGVIATPAASAQKVCDLLVAAGVRSVLNFAPTVLTVPANVDVRRVDLSTELHVLAFHEQRKALADGAQVGSGPTGSAGPSTGPATPVGVAQ